MQYTISLCNIQGNRITNDIYLLNIYIYISIEDCPYNRPNSGTSYIK